MKRTIIYLIFLTLFLASCDTETFETTINIDFRSYEDGLDTESLPFCLEVRSLEDNVIDPSHTVGDTLYANEFGVFNQTMELDKLPKNLFYQLKIIETDKVLPLEDHVKPIRAGIINNIEYRVEPKYPKYIILADSSKEYIINQLQMHTSRGTISKFERNVSMPDSGNRLFIIGAPSHCTVFVTILLEQKNTGEFLVMYKEFYSEEIEEVWVNY